MGMATSYNGCPGILRFLFMLTLTKTYLFYIAADGNVPENWQLLPQYSNKTCTENTTYVYVTQESYPGTCYKIQQDCNFWGCNKKVVPYTCYRQRYKEVVASMIVPACCVGYLPTEHNYTCVRGCETGFFGLNCTQNCSCPANAFSFCDVDFGNCTCKPGWTGDNCSEVCQSGYYGQDCKEQCTCKNNAFCDPVNGTCNCTDGWKGLTCEEECPEGLYGANCSYNCSCPVNKTCDRFNGECTCPAGLKGDNCSIGCSNDTYGRDCRETCACVRDNTESCAPVDGACICNAGWTENLCQEHCRRPFFGLNCSELCTCTDAQDCNPVNGSCTCKEGYLEPNCTIAQGHVGTLKTGTQTLLIAVIACSLVVLMIIGCVAFFIVARLRMRNKTDEKNLSNGNIYPTGDGIYKNSTFENYVNMVDAPAVQLNKNTSSPLHVKAPNNDMYAVVEKRKREKKHTTADARNKHTRSPKSSKNDVYASMKSPNDTVKPDSSKGTKAVNAKNNKRKTGVDNHDNTTFKDGDYDLLSKNKKRNVFKEEMPGDNYDHLLSKNTKQNVVKEEMSGDNYDHLSKNAKQNVVKEDMPGDNYDHLHALNAPKDPIIDSSQYDTMKTPVTSETRDDIYDRVTDVQASSQA